MMTGGVPKGLKAGYTTGEIAGAGICNRMVITDRLTYWGAC